MYYRRCGQGAHEPILLTDKNTIKVSFDRFWAVKMPSDQEPLWLYHINNEFVRVADWKDDQPPPNTYARLLVFDQITRRSRRYMLIEQPQTAIERTSVQAQRPLRGPGSRGGRVSGSFNQRIWRPC